MPVALRVLALAIVRVFFRRIEVSGLENLPSGVPIVFVANHPNGLVDPLVLRVAVGGPLPFLAKSTFFGNPFGRLAMRAFGALPVYRLQDGENTDKNEETFANCRQILASNGRLALFPEGTSHSDSAMRPLRTGASRIALGAEAENDFSLGVQFVPVGLFYEAKQTFRSRVVVRVGAPVAAESVKQTWLTDERAAAQRLTDAIRDALAKLVLQAQTSEIRDGLVAVAGWTSLAASEALSEREAQARRLSPVWETLVLEDPARAESLARKARQFYRLLQRAGLSNPHALQSANVVVETFRFVAGQAMLAPFALLGAVLGWVPYRVLDVIARRVKETDIVSTVKIIGGMAVIGGVWLVESIIAGVWLGVWAVPVTLVVAPACGLAAVRFMERIELRRDLFRGTVLRATSSRLVQAIQARRIELANEVEGLLAAAEKSTSA